MKLVEDKHYQLANAGDVFDDNNDGYIFGIYWLNDFGDVDDCQWFKTEEERKTVIDNTDV